MASMKLRLESVVVEDSPLKASPASTQRQPASTQPSVVQPISPPPSSSPVAQASPASSPHKSGTQQQNRPRKTHVADVNKSDHSNANTESVTIETMPLVKEPEEAEEEDEDEESYEDAPLLSPPTSIAASSGSTHRATPGKHDHESTRGVRGISLNSAAGGASNSANSIDIAEASSGVSPRKILKISMRHYAALSSYWFGWAFLSLPLLVIIIPKQIVDIAGDSSKESALSSTLFMGALSSLICAPMFGAMSDRCTSVIGRRRPFIVVGTVLASIALMIMATSPALEWLSMAFLMLSIANNMIMAPCSALLPDAVPPDQRGTASSWIGGLTMCGAIFGGLLSYHIDNVGIIGAYVILILVHAMSAAITVYFVPEVPLEGTLPRMSCCQHIRSVFKPLCSRDFRVVFATRFLMQMGILTVQEFLQYYLKDAIGKDNYILSGSQVADTPEKATAILFIPVLVGAFISATISGFISDRCGGRRKVIVYISASIMATACVFFAITRNYEFDVFLSLLFGIGYGSFSVIEWAMATDVLPHHEDFAKDMGVWSLAMVLPQVIAAPIAVKLLNYFNGLSPDINLGYSMIFLLAVLYNVGGAYFVRYIEKVK